MIGGIKIKFIPQGKYTSDDMLIEIYNIEDGLTLEKSFNYITDQINNGYIFETAKITSDSDKDNWQNFSGRETYSDYTAFMNMLKSEELKTEKGVTVSFTGKIAGVDKTIAFFIDENWIKIYTPIKKIL